MSITTSIRTALAGPAWLEVARGVRQAITDRREITEAPDLIDLVGERAHRTLGGRSLAAWHERIDRWRNERPEVAAYLAAGARMVYISASRMTEAHREMVREQGADPDELPGILLVVSPDCGDPFCEVHGVEGVVQPQPVHEH